MQRLPFHVHPFDLLTLQLEQEPENLRAVFVREVNELNADDRPLLPSDDWFDLNHPLFSQYQNTFPQRPSCAEVVEKLFAFAAQDLGPAAAYFGDQKTDLRAENDL